ncbi:unnamed protein product [Acanthoscelides obtectus]|uniref:Uncharacterized protein n=1 Tax=Acanthoscelides obtectus TaxID=200917 RepID=A0A9P0LQP7_ACAOB|nr:unnamed protein product [Acanthoscelides obtectus]CAK1634037.1 hypothetical protein AOBTE_LOCUS8557 [Acanthoscelides obtectus]
MSEVRTHLATLRRAPRRLCAAQELKCVFLSTLRILLPYRPLNINGVCRSNPSIYQTVIFVEDQCVIRVLSIRWYHQ